MLARRPTFRLSDLRWGSCRPPEPVLRSKLESVHSLPRIQSEGGKQAVQLTMSQQRHARAFSGSSEGVCLLSFEVAQWESLGTTIQPKCQTAAPRTVPKIPRRTGVWKREPIAPLAKVFV